MNVLDENITEGQRELLSIYGVRARHIGRDIGRAGMTDDEILPLLHHVKRPTFFTVDGDFYQRRFCHPSYCLVRLDAPQRIVPALIRRFLRHPRFVRWSQRRGRVIHVSPVAIRVWRLHAAAEEIVAWPA